MNKQVYYLIGAYGCGKTSTVRKISEERDDIHPILEDGIILDFMKTENIYLRSCVYLPIYMYRIKEAIEKTDKPIILTDGHPMVSMFYLKCFFEMESGLTVDIRDLMYFGRLHNNLVRQMDRMFLENPQTIIHVELPYAKHWDMVLNRLKEEDERYFTEEADEYYLRSIRRVFSDHARIYAEEMYHAAYIKVDNLEIIKNLIRKGDD